MGWSLAAEASRTLDRWKNKCEEQTGMANTFIVDNKRYYFETTNRTKDDGSVTGQIYRFVNETHVVPSGRFRIEPDGKVSIGPKFLKQL